MQKFKPMTQQELAQRIIRRVPEVNPAYVRKTLAEAYEGDCSELDVLGWIVYFENALYGRKGA